MRNPWLFNYKMYFVTDMQRGIITYDAYRLSEIKRFFWLDYIDGYKFIITDKTVDPDEFYTLSELDAPLIELNDVFTSYSELALELNLQTLEKSSKPRRYRFYHVLGAENICGVYIKNA